VSNEPTSTEKTTDRQGFLRTGAALGLAAGAAGSLLGASPALASSRTAGRSAARTAAKSHFKMVLIQIQPQSVPTAWFQGIKQVTDPQNNITATLLDGQNNLATQIGLINTSVNQGVDVIFLQPADSVAVGPAIKKAQAKGIPVITLNIDANENHAAHVTMNHYYDAMAVAQAMGKRLGGKGNVVILNAPPGIIIRDQRTNGFTDGLKKYWPKIKVVSDQNAEWDRKKAQDIFTTMLAGNSDINGVYGVNDDMALGAVDVAKSKGIIKKLAIFGNDGEKAALQSIAAGELTGTAYTDVWQQGRMAAAAAIVLTTGGVSPSNFKQKGNLLMPYTIVTKANVNTIAPSARW
jgi:ribose transport system substrate-binding protein